MSERPAVTIRPITADDAEAAAGLSGALGYPAETHTMRARIERLTQLEGHAVFVACLDGRVVGWIHLLIAEHLQADVRAEIGGLVVAEGARGAGIGARLVDRGEKWARGYGLDTVIVRSQISRDAAHRFYRREGYTHAKTSAVFSKRL